jgi:hypothetical protein
MRSVYSISSDDFIRGELFETDLKEIPSVFYSKIDHAPHFLHTVGRFIRKPFVLVTHNGDLPVNDALLNYAKTIPNLKKWFGQNIECRQDPLVQSIPIGLENDKNFPELEKRRRLKEVIDKEIDHPTSPSKLLYLNYSFSTNRSEREGAWQTVTRNVSSSVCTDRCIDSAPQAQYGTWLTDVINHHYVLCPRGNGIDTHRLWETLYLGRIPIVKRDSNTRYYEKLPILFVESWDQVTETLLNSSLDRFDREQDFDIGPLKMSWWKTEIANTLREYT